MARETGLREIRERPRLCRCGARPRWLAGLLLGLLPVLAGPTFAPSSIAQTAVASEPSAHVWLDAKGKPLPFKTDDELLEFLRAARVVDRQTTEEGINRPSRLLLEHEGLRARAIFRDVDDEKKRTRVEGRYYSRFLDHYAFECAAYDLARRLGIDTVPPATIRRIGSSEGSVQAWVENASSTTAPDFRPKSPIGWVRQQWDMHLFDNLIFNADRNAQNTLAGENGELWLIDHGRAFQPNAELLAPEKVVMINRQIWERLQAMSDEELKDVVRAHLDTEQLNCLVKRRELLVELVEDLVAEKGEDKVFY
jgi:hypothetical protein